MPSDNPESTTKQNESNPLSSASFAKTLEMVGKVVAPATVLTTLLFYFGWARTNALYRYFGIDQSILGFSTQDYVLRSIPVTFEPVRWMLLLSIAAAWGHHAMGRLMTTNLTGKLQRAPDVAVRVILGSGIGLLLAGPVAVWLGMSSQLNILFYPSVWTGGVTLTAYGVVLTGRLRASRIKQRESTAKAPLPGWLYQISLWATIGLFVLGLFWTVANYADIIGRWSAQQIANQPDTLPSVIIYSRAPLTIEATGIEETRVSYQKDAYQFRYTNLKFLVRSDEKFFLLPADWSPGATTIILPDTEAIRIEVARGGSPTENTSAVP